MTSAAPAVRQRAKVKRGLFPPELLCLWTLLWDHQDEARHPLAESTSTASL